MNCKFLVINCNRCTPLGTAPVGLKRGTNGGASQGRKNPHMFAPVGILQQEHGSKRNSCRNPKGLHSAACPRIKSEIKLAQNILNHIYNIKIAYIPTT